LQPTRSYKSLHRSSSAYRQDSHGRTQRNPPGSGPSKISLPQRLRPSRVCRCKMEREQNLLEMPPMIYDGRSKGVPTSRNLGKQQRRR
jgi:hypothetical protein